MTGQQSLSITELHSALAALDPQGSYKEVSYNLTAHNALAQDAWWVFMPFDHWDGSGTPPMPNPSPWESTVLWTIPSGSTNQCFIDVLHLDHAMGSFFKDPSATQTIAGKLASYINGLPQSVTPVIRYVVGAPGVPFEQDEFVQALFQPPIITHPKACFYFGNFTPGFQLTVEDQLVAAFGLEQAVSGIWDWLLAEIEKYGREIYDEVKALASEMIAWITRFIPLVVLDKLSWNHSKIFAVNGTSLTTSGANFWAEYCTNQGADLFDLGMRITGDAAIDAHKFANYFWQYLAKIPATDKSSYSKWNQLTKPISGFADGPAPIFTDFPTNAGSTAVLSVAKNGNWPLQDPGFPIQIFDGIRDFILNILAVIVETHFSSRPEITAFVANALSDDNERFRETLGELGVNPAAWASRYSRNYAIRQARRSVRFSQQKFVLDDLAASGDPRYKKLVDEVNTHTKSNWNGYIWPFDTLRALGTALANMSQGAQDAATGIQIVCSYYGPGTIGYQDSVSRQDFAAKLGAIMRGMQRTKEIDPSLDVDKLISTLLVYKRVGPPSSQTRYSNHSKLVIVDDSVSYVGSCNAYPSYNQEFGLWIDDQPSIQSFLAKYWNTLWASFTHEDH